MIKKLATALSVIWAATSVLAQTTPVQIQQTYPNPGSAYPNQTGANGVTFSNHAGQSFSTADLAMQLQNLRAMVDQTLPVLSAFNEQSSNSASGGRQTVGGALSGIVSDVLHRNQAAGQNSPAGQSSLTTSNLMAFLHGLLNTNSPNAVGTSPSNTQDLIALENELRSVQSVLQRLNVTANPNLVNSPYNNRSQPYPGGNLEPTGR